MKQVCLNLVRYAFSVLSMANISVRVNKLMPLGKRVTAIA